MSQPPPVLDFGDVIADLAIYLRHHPMLLGVNVVTDMVDYRRGDDCLLLDRSGGTRDRFYDNAFIVIEARGSSQDRAYEITQAARSIAWASPGTMLDVVAVEDVAGPLRLTDSVNQDQFYRFSVMLKKKGRKAP